MLQPTNQIADTKIDKMVARKPFQKVMDKSMNSLLKHFQCTQFWL